MIFNRNCGCGGLNNLVFSNAFNRCNSTLLIPSWWIMGPRGITGPTGATGATGPTGPTGATGATG